MSTEVWLPVWRKVLKRTVLEVDGCLIWTGPIHKNGYGMVNAPGRRTMRTHRVAWLALVGDIPDGLVIDHLCHVRACCNIQHLRLVTTAKNLENQVHARSNSKTGHLNVRKTERGFRVKMVRDGKTISHRTKTIEEAVKWRDDARASRGEALVEESS